MPIPFSKGFNHADMERTLNFIIFKGSNQLSFDYLNIMKFAKFNGKKTHASQVVSGVFGSDLWYTEYEVVACVGKYRQYWKYTGLKPELPNGYETETEWHAAWKEAIIDDSCEVVCGENKEHRADIKSEQFVIEIQKSPIDGWAVIERNNFYKNLTNTRVIWIVNIETPWKQKRISLKYVKDADDGRFEIDWKYKWKWVEEISVTTDTFLFLDFNVQNDKLIYAWTYKNKMFGKWVSKLSFFEKYLLTISKEEYRNNKERFLDIFKSL